MRKFAEGVEMEELYAFVECRDMLEGGEGDGEKGRERPEGYEHKYGFRLVSPMPRAVYDLENGGTIAERVGRSGNLIVEMKEVEEDE